jgi:hypothetical protein
MIPAYGMFFKLAGHQGRGRSESRSSKLIVVYIYSDISAPIDPE